MIFLVLISGVCCGPKYRLLKPRVGTTSADGLSDIMLAATPRV